MDDLRRHSKASSNQPWQTSNRCSNQWGTQLNENPDLPDTGTNTQAITVVASLLLENDTDSFTCEHLGFVRKRLVPLLQFFLWLCVCVFIYGIALSFTCSLYVLLLVSWKGCDLWLWHFLGISTYTLLFASDTGSFASFNLLYSLVSYRSAFLVYIAVATQVVTRGSSYHIGIWDVI